MKRLPEQSLTPNQERTALVGAYLLKYAAIANRDMGKSGELVEIFVEALDDLSPKELKRGLEKYLREGNRFPWPNDIREAAELG